VSNEVSVPSSVAYFCQRNLITAVLGTIKSGKEASVYQCAAHPSTGETYFALKVYRPLRERAFRNASMYWAGRLSRENRAGRAILDKSEFGIHAAIAAWVKGEFSTLRKLHAAGASVPRVIAYSSDSLLMEFIGDAAGPAPQLRTVDLDREQAAACWEQILAAITTALQLGCVHADLSAYNILYQGERAVLIDFPQAVDPGSNENAEALLHRDISAIAQWLRTRGVTIDATTLAAELWLRWRRCRW
jgi:RIO kinase 1